MNRILVITPYYYPDIAANVGLMKDLCKYLSSRWLVDVLSNQPSSWRLRAYAYSQKGVKPHETIYWIPNPFVVANNIIIKILEYLYFFLACFHFVSKNRKKYNVIFCQSTPPLISIVVSMATQGRIPIVYNVQDLFPDSLSPITHVHKYPLLSILERKSYSVCSRVTTISEDFVERIRQRSTVSVDLMPNWIDTNIIRYIPREENLVFQKYSSLFSGKYIILYSGNIGYNQDFDLLLRAARRLVDQDVIFVFFGNGSRKKHIEKELKRNGIMNIALLPPVEESLIPQVYSLADVCVLPMKRNATEGSFPSKTWSILACQRDFIVNVDSKSFFASMIKNNQLAYVRDSGDTEGFLDGVDTVRSCPGAMASSQLVYVRQHCEKYKVLEKYEELFNSLAKLQLKE
jgi:glycosyltransferase involved in cell wall biosynthesis